MNTNFKKGSDGILVIVKPTTIKRYRELMYDRSLYSMPLSPAYFAEYKRREELVKKECDPQEVYCFEYNNYECMYSCEGDWEAIERIIDIFGLDVAQSIKRVSDCYSVEYINEQKHG